MLWKRETVLMLNPKKGAYSEMAQIPINEIESASKLVFKMHFPKVDPKEEPAIQPDTPIPDSPTAPPRKRSKLSSQGSESGLIVEKAKRNRTKLNGTCSAVMELGLMIQLMH